MFDLAVLRWPENPSYNQDWKLGFLITLWQRL